MALINFEDLPSTATPLNANNLNNNFNYCVPTGGIVEYAGTTAPNGWLLCDGSAISRTTYADLFEVIGTTFGEGDGSTTFNLPNLQNKFIEGAGTNPVGTEMSAGLPNITGTFGIKGNGSSGVWGYSEGAFTPSSTGTTIFFNGTTAGNSESIGYYDFNASKSNSIYGNSNTVQPPAVVMNYIIKY